MKIRVINIQGLSLKKDSMLSLWGKQAYWTGYIRLVGMKWPPHNIQLDSPPVISLHAGFCFRSCCPPLRTSNCTHESGANPFCSHKAVFILHCQPMSHLKTSLLCTCLPGRKGQSISVSFDTDLDFNELWFVRFHVFLN